VLVVGLPFIAVLLVCSQAATAYRQSLQLLTLLSGTDSDTGCENKLRLREALQTAFAFYQRYDSPSCALILCVYWQPGAQTKETVLLMDEGLRRICGIWRSRLRVTDRLFRLADNRFIFLLQNTAPENASVLIDDLMRAIAHYELPGKERFRLSHVLVDVSEVGSAETWLASLMSHHCSSEATPEQHHAVSGSKA
jgi:PleD family two-component response regulator